MQGFIHSPVMFCTPKMATEMSPTIVEYVGYFLVNQVKFDKAHPQITNQSKSILLR